MLRFNLRAFPLPNLSLMPMWSDLSPEEKSGLYYMSLFSSKVGQDTFCFSPVLHGSVIIPSTALKYHVICNPGV